MGTTVIEVLRRFLPVFLRGRPALKRAQGRAIWAITHCRTAVMGGHLDACEPGCTREFHFHSCNHRSCPQCGREHTAEWVARELGRRVGAAYFMVTFTLPKELRGLFFTSAAKEIYDVLFAAAAAALSGTMGDPRWLGAVTSGHTAILHTWTQRQHFHPHLHCIVPGAGLDAHGRVVTVKNANFLVPQPVLRRAFRAAFRERLAAVEAEHGPFQIDDSVWEKDWGVHLQAFGDGTRAIQYLGAYVCRGPIGDSRIIGMGNEQVSFRWKDRAKGGAPRVESISGVEFVARYLRHVLPKGMRAVRQYGFCHPAAQVKREKIAFLTGRPLLIGAAALTPPKPERPPKLCPCCGGPLLVVRKIEAPWAAARERRRARARPPPVSLCRHPTS
jgi:Putative transposase/Transposase zinc-binding domain